MSRYSVIFCAFFCTSKKWWLLAQVSRTSNLKLVKAWPAARPGSLATYAGCWQCNEPLTSRARVALLHLSTVTGSTFVFRLRGPEQSDTLLQGSRLAVTAISILILSLMFRSARLPKISAISSRRAWVTERRNRQHGRSSLCSGSDDVCHCEGKCAERGTSSRKGCRRSCQPADLLCCDIRTVCDTDLNTQETHLW